MKPGVSLVIGETAPVFGHRGETAAVILLGLCSWIPRLHPLPGDQAAAASASTAPTELASIKRSRVKRRVSLNAFRKSGCPSVPEGHLRIAQRFSVGFETALIRVPKGRLTSITLGLVSAVPSGRNQRPATANAYFPDPTAR